MSEAGDRKPALVLQPLTEIDQLGQLAPRDDDVLVELRQPCRTQAVGECPADIPERLAAVLRIGSAHAERTEREQFLLQGAAVEQHRVPLPVELDEHVGLAAGHHLATNVRARRR